MERKGKNGNKEEREKTKERGKEGREERKEGLEERKEGRKGERKGKEVVLPLCNCLDVVDFPRHLTSSHLHVYRLQKDKTNG